MSRSDQKLSETDIRPAGALVYVVRADTDDSREWLSESPICPELQRYRIRHLAVAKMASPFQIVRTRLSGSYFLACFGGKVEFSSTVVGRIAGRGRQYCCHRTLQAFHTTPCRVWTLLGSLSGTCRSTAIDLGTFTRLDRIRSGRVASGDSRTLSRVPVAAERHLIG